VANKAHTHLAHAVVAYFRAAKRDLPWRRTRDPYAIWVSEIMLQQTRVATVIPYYERWMQLFPTVEALAHAPLDDVLAAWSGLGYYSRARNLHRGAKYTLEHYRGVLPQSADALCQLPGIGRYTAGAIASIAFAQRVPVVDGNVARVLARLYAIEGNIKSSASTRRLWSIAGELVPSDAPGDFNQGLMELGATVCTPTSPACLVCPLRDPCRAYEAGRERELPHMPARKSADSLPLIDASALYIVVRGRLLLARRVPSGLFGGLWELPQTEDSSRLDGLVPGARVTSATPLWQHRQTLTHRRLLIRVYAAEMADSTTRAHNRLGKPGHERYDKLAWHSLDAVATRGVSAATQAIIQALSEKEPWNSIKKPSRSSMKGSRKS
jgi:A/G-specific adenine glycosylase